MALGYESSVINGQLVSTAPEQAFAPLSYGPSLSGPGYWPAGSQYNLPPLLPSSVATTGAASYSQSANTTSTPSAGTSAGSVSNSGKINWFSPTKSPAIWVIVLLALSLFMLHKVHYGKG
jgi:hypothetical protein